MRAPGLIILFLLFQSTAGRAQSEIPFISHLVNQKYYKEAIYLIENNNQYYNNSQQDSVNYLRGWAHYSLKNLEQSSASFLEVSKESPFYRKSHFFAGYNQIYLGNYTAARKVFSRMEIKEEPFMSLKNLELTGIEMLEEKWKAAIHHITLIDSSNAVVSEQVAALKAILSENEKHRSKSPVLAGIMSGILPGSGKIYAGNTGAGIASMIGTVGFGLITWENYRKLGIADAKTIIFGSIFAATYISNIYGSVISVKVLENEYKDAVHNQILFQLHIPLRNFFE